VLFSWVGFDKKVVGKEMVDFGSYIFGLGKRLPVGLGTHPSFN
jgi:hypothetical protein